MKALILRAHYDGNQIHLDDPYDLKPGTPLTVTVLPKQPHNDEQIGWRRLSRQHLARAYGLHEPEYSLDLITVPNPDHAGG